MNKRVKQHLTQYCESRGWEPTPIALIEIVRDAKCLHREEVNRSRWWNEHEYVVEINDMLIGYTDAEATGDMSAEERGYEFNPSTICEMQAVEKTVVTYVPVAD